MVVACGCACSPEFGAHIDRFKRAEKSSSSSVESWLRCGGGLRGLITGRSLVEGGDVVDDEAGFAIKCLLNCECYRTISRCIYYLILILLVASQRCKNFGLDYYFEYLSPVAVEDERLQSALLAKKGFSVSASHLDYAAAPRPLNKTITNIVITKLKGVFTWWYSVVALETEEALRGSLRSELEGLGCGGESRTSSSRLATLEYVGGTMLFAWNVLVLSKIR